MAPYFGSIEYMEATDFRSFVAALNRWGAPSENQVYADDKLTALSSGEEIDIHGTMIAMKEAELSLRLATTMRDKFVEAYNKIINLQI